MAAIDLGGRRPERKKMRRWRRFTAPRRDSFGGEVEGDAAESLPRVDLLGEAPNGGDA